MKKLVLIDGHNLLFRMFYGIPASISSKEEAAMEYMGAVIYGNTKDVDEITGKFQLWRID